MSIVNSGTEERRIPFYSQPYPNHGGSHQMPVKMPEITCKSVQTSLI